MKEWKGNLFDCRVLVKFDSYHLPSAKCMTCLFQNIKSRLHDHASLSLHFCKLVGTESAFNFKIRSLISFIMMLFLVNQISLAALFWCNNRKFPLHVGISLCKLNWHLKANFFSHSMHFNKLMPLLSSIAP